MFEINIDSYRSYNQQHKVLQQHAEFTNSTCFSDSLNASPLSFVRAGNVNNGSLNNLGSNGNYWSRTVNNDNNAYNLNFNDSNVNPQNNDNRNNGFSVRCIAL